jgi:ubiquinone/menaquinone biosynthesis C-methylase UbiE
MNRETTNLDIRVAEGFGDEWKRFDQSCLSDAVQEQMFAAYFAGFPWAELPAGAAGADFGCGSGRWALRVAPRVGKLYCVDASTAALEVSRKNLRHVTNCEFVLSSVGNMPIPEASLDFGYSLGVLHHVPDAFAGLASCVRTLKPGAPFLLYLYYRMENRPVWYRALWAGTDCVRRMVSRLPHSIRYLVSQIVATLVYWPLARGAGVAQKLGFESRNLPLQFYADKPFYVMRTDALDRLGTRIEWRFSKAEMKSLMERAGLRNVVFGCAPPFWCAIGYREA